jgi:predicted Zn-ribbon and HTH transcriptional regulator
MEVVQELSFEEMSALCSNLAKACTKQLRPEEANLFTQLSDYYKFRSKPAEKKQFNDLVDLVQKDLSSGYSDAGQVASQEADRGALRALVWGEKVTTLLKSLISRYEKQKDALLESTNVFVCEICGFVFVGDEPPAICPICKAPNEKLTKVIRGAK